MRIAILLALSILCGATALSAQETGEVRGRVLDSRTGAPAAGARVSFAGSERHVHANAAGEFALCAVPAGAVRVRAEGDAGSVAERQVVVAVGGVARQDLALAREGDPTSPRIHVHCSNYLVVGQKPLLVVDGRRVGVAPYDGCRFASGPGGEAARGLPSADRIESLEILKASTAVARYGADAADGAIVIVTGDRSGPAPR